jgi:hypothetical protein
LRYFPVRILFFDNFIGAGSDSGGLAHHYLKNFHFRGGLFVMSLDNGFKDHLGKSFFLL